LHSTRTKRIITALALTGAIALTVLYPFEEDQTTTPDGAAPTQVHSLNRRAALPFAPQARRRSEGLAGDSGVPTPLNLDASVTRHGIGKVEEARAGLALWCQKNANHADSPAAHLLLGLWHLDANEPQQALDALTPKTAPNDLKDIGLDALSRAYRANGQPEDALPLLKQLLAMTLSPLSPQARFDHADALFESKQLRPALKAYQDALETYPDYPGQWHVRERVAACHHALQQTKTAIKGWRTVARAVPQRPEGQRAQHRLATLRAEGVSIEKRTVGEELQWGTQLRKDRRWADAILVLDRLQPRVRTRKDRGELHWQRAKTLESLERFDDALAALDIARRNGVNTRWIRRARSRIHQKQGRVAEAVRGIRTLNPNRRKADLAAAKIYRETGAYRNAAPLLRDHLNPTRNGGDRWALAWMDYRTGRLQRAEDAFGELARRSNATTPKARYWLGRVQLDRKRLTRARRTFRALAKAKPRAYYGIQAMNRLLDMGDDAWVQTQTQASALPSAAERDKPSAHIRWGGFEGKRDLLVEGQKRDPAAFENRAAAYTDAIPAVRKAAAAYRLGLDDHARQQLRLATSEHKRTRSGRVDDLAREHSSVFVDNRKKRKGLWGRDIRQPKRLSQDALRRETQRIVAMRAVDGDIQETLYDLLWRAGDPWGSRKLAMKNHARLLRGVPTDDNRPLFRKAFPFPFHKILFKESHRYKMSPYFMSAIARVESAYNTLAISSANARGIVQVLPVTGHLIARRRADHTFTAEDLLDPAVGLPYGTWYMKQLLIKFHGQEPLAIAAYNAGPHRMAQWLRHRGKSSPLDVFIEEIPFRQARRYVKKVLSIMALYRWVYEDQPVMYIGQKIRPDYQNNINW